MDVRRYYKEDEELVLFDSAEELIEKCRYYLAKPEERSRIAANGRRRAQAELTVKSAAEQFLAEWRKLL